MYHETKMYECSGVYEKKIPFLGKYLLTNKICFLCFFIKKNENTKSKFAADFFIKI